MERYYIRQTIWDVADGHTKYELNPNFLVRKWGAYIDLVVMRLYLR